MRVKALAWTSEYPCFQHVCVYVYMFGLPFQMHAKVCVGTDMYVHTCTYITYMHTCFRWKDKLPFPMLVKNGKTGERNVLWLHHLEAEGVPDVSPILVLILVIHFSPESVLTCTLFLDDRFGRRE